VKDVTAAILGDRALGVDLGGRRIIKKKKKKIRQAVKKNKTT
jgi:hypothetical protein